MKKIISLSLFILAVNICTGQIFSTKESVITFFSEAPLENIEAINKVGKIILNTSNNELVARVPVNGFIFEKPLMQEHFNENYMESDRYPMALFKGKINEAIDYTKEGVHKVTATGKLNVHGIEKERTINGTLTVKKDEIAMQSEFTIRLEDHKISIPKVVFEKIAETVQVKINGTLIPFQKK